jgi:hypothetical protein
MCAPAGRAMLIPHHHPIGYKMSRTTHYIAARAVEGAAFYTVAFGALALWAQYWGARKQRSHQG